MEARHMRFESFRRLSEEDGVQTQVLVLVIHVLHVVQDGEHLVGQAAHVELGDRGTIQKGAQALTFVVVNEVVEVATFDKDVEEGVDAAHLTTFHEGLIFFEV